MKFRFVTLCASALLVVSLSACKTTVVTDEERELPQKEQQNNGGSAQVSTKTYVADLTQSFIAFTGSKGIAVSHEGRFNTYHFTFDRAKDIAKSSLELTIDIRSLKTDSDGLTRHLLNEDFFEADSYPLATFSAKKFAEIGAGLYAVTGDLTLKGVTKSITFDAEITDNYFVMKYDLDRVAFNVGGSGKYLTELDVIVPIEAKIVFL